MNLAVSVAKEYGLPSLLADKSGLVDFTKRTFAGILEKLSLSQHDWDILRLLAAEHGMPIAALAACVEVSEGEVAKVLHKLVDLNLVIPSEVTFTIAQPIKNAVRAVGGVLGPREFARIAEYLKASFWDMADKLPPFEIIETTVHALLRSYSTDLGDFKDLVLPSTLYRSAKQIYDRGGQDSWERSLQLIKELLRMDPDHRQGLGLLLKVRVRLGEWEEAKKTLEVIRSKNLPELHYLTGFYLWKRRKFGEAVSAFRTAIRLGHDSAEVYHGLVTCLFRLDNLPDAERVIAAAMERRRRPNALLLDLAAQIAIAGHRYDDAEQYIDQLRRVRADADYHHRLAVLLNVRKRFNEALPHAEEARKGARRRFEVEATLVDTLIELRRFVDASELLDDLDKLEGKHNRDVRLGLRCKLLIRQGQWDEAERIWDQLEEKLRPVHVALRAEILMQKASDLSVSPGKRAEANAELGGIKSTLGWTQALVFLDDDDGGDEPDESEGL